MEKFLRNVMLTLVNICTPALLIGQMVVHSTADTSLNLAGSLYFYEDKSQTQDISQIIGQSRQFTRNEHQNLNFGFTLSAYWLRFSIENQGTEEYRVILNLANPDLNEVDFFVTDGDSVIRSVEAGEARKFSQRDIEHRNFLFKLQVPPGQMRDFYLRSFNNGDANFLPLSIHDELTFFKSDNNELLFNGFYFGLAFFIFVFNIFLFLLIRSGLYLHYSFYVLFNSLFLLNINGLSAEFLWPGLPYVAVHSTILFASLCMVFLVLFIKKYLNTRTHLFMNGLFNWCLYLSLASAFLSCLDYPVYLFVTYFMTALTPLIILLGVLFSIVKVRRSPDAVYFVSAFLLTIAGLVLYLLMNAGLVSENLFTFNALRIGILLEMFILTVGVVDRIQREQRDNHLALSAQKDELDVINKELEKLNVAISKTDSSVVIFGSEGQFEWANFGFVKLYNVTLEMVRSQVGASVFNLPDEFEVKRKFKVCVDDKKAVVFESYVPTNYNEKFIWTQTILTPILGADGQVIRVVSVSTDISALKETEKELIIAKERAEESEKLKASFLANMSHEIRSPMNAIVGFSKLLNSDKLSAQDRKEYYTYIRNSVNTLLRLVDDIMDVSKIEAGQISIRKSPVSVVDLMNELLISHNETRASRKKDHLTITLNIPPAHKKLVMMTDEFRLRQVLSNLIENAIKYTHQGAIDFGFAMLEDHRGKAGKFIQFYVKDTGVGIPEHMKEAVFQRFKKLEDDKAKLYRGVGLGLSIVKSLVEMMRGEIELESELDKGSVFYVTFTLVGGNLPDSVEEPRPEHERIKKDLQGKKILIAEDEEYNIELYKRLLGNKGAELYWAFDGVEVVELMKNTPDLFDLVLMDIKMPKKDGLTATREIRAVSPHVPIIALTAYALGQDRDQCLEAGCNYYLSKPLDEKKLFQVIRQCLNG